MYDLDQIGNWLALVGGLFFVSPFSKPLTRGRIGTPAKIICGANGLNRNRSGYHGSPLIGHLRTGTHFPGYAVNRELVFLREGFQERFKAVHNLNGQFTDSSLGENLVAGAGHFKEGV